MDNVIDIATRRKIPQNKTKSFSRDNFYNALIDCEISGALDGQTDVNIHPNAFERWCYENGKLYEAFPKDRAEKLEKEGVS